MSEEQRNNPLHGIKLETLLTELVDHYGWEVLADAMNFNCFKSNPSIKSSLKFLRKTLWAREKLENFYLYKFKRLPRASEAQYEMSPRERTLSGTQKQDSVDDKTKKPESQHKKPEYQHKKKVSDAPKQKVDVWGNWKKDT